MLLSLYFPTVLSRFLSNLTQVFFLFFSAKFNSILMYILRRSFFCFTPQTKYDISDFGSALSKYSFTGNVTLTQNCHKAVILRFLRTFIEMCALFRCALFCIFVYKLANIFQNSVEFPTWNALGQNYYSFWIKRIYCRHPCYSCDTSVQIAWVPRWTELHNCVVFIQCLSSPEMLFS